MKSFFRMVMHFVTNQRRLKHFFSGKTYKSNDIWSANSIDLSPNGDFKKWSTKTLQQPKIYDLLFRKVGTTLIKEYFSELVKSIPKELKLS